MDSDIRELKIKLDQKQKQKEQVSIASVFTTALKAASLSIQQSINKIADSVSSSLAPVKDSLKEIESKSDTVLQKLEEVKRETAQISSDGLASTEKELSSKIESLEETIKKKDFRGPKGDSIKGEKGDRGERGIDGRDGERGPRGINGKDGKDGKNGRDGNDGKDGSPDTPEQVRDKLTSLRGSNRLSASAIKDLQKYVQAVSTTVIGAAGSAGAAISDFLGLSDTPESYSGQAGKLVRVNDDESGLEFTVGNPGDITSITAGSGLSGGGSSGDVTVSLDENYDAGPYLRKDQNLTDLTDWSIAVSSLKLDSNASGEGASLIGVEDSAGEYTATTQEALNAELGTRFIRKTNKTAKDQGYEQSSSIDGVTADYISDKTLHNIALKGHPGTKQVGSLWTDNTVTPSVLYIRLNGVNNTIKYDFITTSDELEHTPLSYLIDVWSGNSNQLGLNGLPLVQEYKTSMGPYPVPILINGGSF